MKAVAERSREQKKDELGTFFGTYFHCKGVPGKSTWEA